MTTVALVPASTRRERRKREIHERLVTAAIGLFERKGFANTTALEISESADVAEKTFYNHFPTKQHLIQELAERSVEHTSQVLAEARRGSASTADRLRRFFHLAADQADHGSRDFARGVVLELVRVAQVDGVGPERSRRLYVDFHAMLEEGRARGDIAADRDLWFLSELAVAAYLGIIINWVSVPGYPLRERLASLADLLCEAVSGSATPAGGTERR